MHGLEGGEVSSLLYPYHGATNSLELWLAAGRIILLELDR